MNMLIILWAMALVVLVFVVIGNIINKRNEKKDKEYCQNVTKEAIKKSIENDCRTLRMMIEANDTQLAQHKISKNEYQKNLIEIAKAVEQVEKKYEYK